MEYDTTGGQAVPPKGHRPLILYQVNIDFSKCCFSLNRCCFRGYFFGFVVLVVLLWYFNYFRLELKRVVLFRVERVSYTYSKS